VVGTARGGRQRRTVGSGHGEGEVGGGGGERRRGVTCALLLVGMKSLAWWIGRVTVLRLGITVVQSL